MGHSGESSRTRMFRQSGKTYFLLQPQGKLFCPKTLLQHVRNFVQGQREVNIKEDFISPFHLSDMLSHSVLAGQSLSGCINPQHIIIKALRRCAPFLGSPTAKHTTTDRIVLCQRCNIKPFFFLITSLEMIKNNCSSKLRAYVLRHIYDLSPT